MKIPKINSLALFYAFFMFIGMIYLMRLITLNEIPSNFLIRISWINLWIMSGVIIYTLYRTFDIYINNQMKGGQT